MISHWGESLNENVMNSPISKQPSEYCSAAVGGASIGKVKGEAWSLIKIFVKCLESSIFLLQ
jgi:hypothetical protein